MGDQHSSKPVWMCERIDGGGRAEIHEHPSGWELRVYLGDRLELRRAFADVREAHEKAMEAVKHDHADQAAGTPAMPAPTSPAAHRSVDFHARTPGAR